MTPTAMWREIRSRCQELPEGGLYLSWSALLEVSRLFHSGPNERIAEKAKRYTLGANR